jgi:hypothetical protein
VAVIEQDRRALPALDGAGGEAARRSGKVRGAAARLFGRRRRSRSNLPHLEETNA